MIDIATLRNTEARVITIGSYPAIIQSILDFDYLAKKSKPSIGAIVASGRNNERYFFGKKEIFIPVYSSPKAIPVKKKEQFNFFLNLSSGRRVLNATQDVLAALPNLLGGVVFAEGVPEAHALELYHQIEKENKFIIGPSSIGLLIPGSTKLGAIGGVDVRQLTDAKLFNSGTVAVLSASGGMTNEIINTVVQLGKRVSFSLSFGGERYPLTTPKDAFLAAEHDPQTEAIVYFGELGGTDEHDLADLMLEKKITKKVICYIAGSIADMFETPPQFGHAKALAQTQEETAVGKRKVLKEAGANVASSYTEFIDLIKSLPDANEELEDLSEIAHSLKQRQKSLISSSISGDKDGQPRLLQEDLLSFTKNHSFATVVSSMFLGRKMQSKELESFVDFILRLLVDHGPYVSGAMNTIVTARAGRDLVSSLSAGLLTIGPRFGGAINQAAENWLRGVSEQKSSAAFVEEFASSRKYISGIGHKKYRVDLPDPRVAEIKKFAETLKEKKYTKFALEVEKITAAKKGNLILNVDGAIAAVLLDILAEKENVSEQKLQQLTEIEFFNALFVLSRSVGFIGHFLDQKRLDEGLFRLPEHLVASVEEND
jgi:ATP citrate (pro-S)-lyase